MSPESPRVDARALSARASRARGGRRYAPAMLVVTATFVLSACLEPAPPLPRNATGPVTAHWTSHWTAGNGGSFPDPFVIKVGNTYHGWATGYSNWPFFRVTYSKSVGGLHNWQEPIEAMPPTIPDPNPPEPDPPEEPEDPEAPPPPPPPPPPEIDNHPAWARNIPSNNFWAPTVLRRSSNEWLLYYAAQTTNRYAIVNGQARGPVWCIGVARASRPEGPYTDVRGVPIVCQADRYGSIDPDVFRDPLSGRIYLYWKSEGYGVGQTGRLWAQQLTSNGLHTTGPRHQILAPEMEWEGTVLENPSMVYRDGKYWLFYSGNDWWTSRYATGVAHCEGPLGPCHRSWSTPMLGSAWNVAGPGGAAPVRGQPGTLAFAAWRPGQVGYSAPHHQRRLYFVDWVTWGGRPYIP